MSEENIEEPKSFWKFCYHMRHIWFHVKKLSGFLARNKFIARVAPPITASYFLVLDVWGEWPWVKNYQEVHFKVF